MEIIRHIKKDEWEDFMRFLERSYGHGWNFFPEHYPDIYQPEDEYLPYFNIVDREGKIVSHIGLFPLAVVADGVKTTVGGIGGVATLPEERGKGYMAKLLQHVISRMQSKNWPLSVLWGDRQRYGNFGWEAAGEKIILNITASSLTKTGIASCSVREVSPGEAEPVVERLYRTQRFRVDRGKRLAGVLRRAGNRIWVGADGYVCGTTGAGSLVVKEVVSSPGKEASLIMAVMEWCFISDARITVPGEDTERFNRLLAVASSWQAVNEGMFRINNCFRLFSLFAPILQKRALSLELDDFSVSIGLRSGKEVDVVSLSYADGGLCVSKDRIEPYVEMDGREAVRLFMGGFNPQGEILGKFSVLLPLPIHIPELDAV